ncbi:MAG: DUF4199 domain-containing protein [Bacteroidetes bacterium]|nr:DUF4199 domain-containing protein [Bacteroidota bacterium]MBS1978716.1 DUF4199 domain-containing protein [Bacteroidota bacterium]
MGLLNDPNRIPENYGLRIAGGLIAFFLVMQLIGLGHHVELRLANLLILSAGVYYGLKKFKNTHEEHMNYFRGLITGVAIAAVGSALFALFMFAYMKLDSGFMQSIIDNEPMGHYLNAYIAAFIVALEGVFSGLLVTFVLMNYVDTDDVNDPAGESQ